MTTAGNATAPRGRAWSGYAVAVCLAAAGAALTTFALPDPGRLGPSAWAIAAGLAIAFWITEVMPLHLESNGQTQSLSLSEFPLVLGLFFCPPVLLVAARVVGGGVALVFHRRQPPEKLLFNVSLQYFEVSLAAPLFAVIAGDAGRHIAMGSLGAGVAVAAAALASLGSVSVVVRLRTGTWDRLILNSVTKTGLLAMATSWCAAVTLTAAIWQSSAVLVPTILVALTGAAGYRRHVELRHRFANLEMIHAFNRRIDRAATNEARVRDLLHRTREVLRCERSEIFLLHPDGEAALTRRWVSDDGPLCTERLAQQPGDWPIARVLSDNEQLVVGRTPRNAGLRHFLETREARDCILTPLRAEDRVIGVLMVANRTSDVSTFTGDDAKLFATVADQVAAALENGQLLDRLTHDSLHDALTGLANRSCYQDRLRLALRRSAHPRLAVLLMDLDRFKEVNDTLGHHHGDLLIREVSARLSDAAPAGATVARLGGDEFAVLLPEADQVAAAEAVRVFRHAVSRPCSLDGVTIDVEASVGVALAPDDGVDDSVLLKRADMAMYAAKSNGSGVEFYDPDRDEYSPRRLSLASRIRTAIDAGEMVLHYQPQVDAQRGRVLAVEALMRWQHPEYGMVPPGEFIPIAEQSGAIAALTRWALGTAVAQLAAWREGGLAVEMAVNLSMRNLLDASVVHLVGDLLTAHDVPAHLLTLEITESHLMVEPGRTLPVLHLLADLGVRLSIDDFGTGYSSLSYLKQLPVREIKIDRAFIRSIATDAQDVAIVKAVTELARSLGLSVVAEGVEDQATYDQVAELGCDRVQGYLISPPLPAADFEVWARGQVVRHFSVVREKAWAGFPPRQRTKHEGRIVGGPR